MSRENNYKSLIEDIINLCEIHGYVFLWTDFKSWLSLSHYRRIYDLINILEILNLCCKTNGIITFEPAIKSMYYNNTTYTYQ